MWARRAAAASVPHLDWGWADAAERAGIRYYPKVLVGLTRPGPILFPIF